MKDPDSHLVFLGGGVKALGNGKVGGYLVLFGDAENTDASSLRDYFTPETDFSIEDGAKTAVWYRHALDPALDRKLCDGEMKVDEVGVWVEAQLNLRDRYEKAVYGMAAKEKLGWSSGTAVHLVRREPQENGAHKILRWPLGLDASLTPDPAEPRTQAVALKSIQWQAPPLEQLARADDITPRSGGRQNQIPLDGDLPAVKAVHLGEWLEQSMTMAALSRLNDALMYHVVYRCLDDDELSAADRKVKLEAAGAEFVSLMVATVEALMGSDPAEDPKTAMKNLRALWADPDRPSTTCRLPVGLTFEQHSGAVLEAAKALCERAQEVKALRAAKSLDLSEARRAEAKELAALFTALAETVPDRSEAVQETERLRTSFLRLTTVGAH